MRGRVGARGGIPVYLPGYGCSYVLIHSVKQVASLHGEFSKGRGRHGQVLKSPSRGLLGALWGLYGAL